MADAPITGCSGSRTTTKRLSEARWPQPSALTGATRSDAPSFLRYFRVAICAADGWLDVTPEAEL
jgi:hypothetical protein